MSKKNRQHPPRIGEKLLRSILPESEKHTLLGDYEELYKDLADRRGRLIANLVAWPISYFAMRNWLANFAYHTRLGLMVFVLAGGCVLLIAMMTVVTQALRAALTNPVDVMKVE